MDKTPIYPVRRTGTLRTELSSKVPYLASTNVTVTIVVCKKNTKNKMGIIIQSWSKLEASVIVVVTAHMPICFVNHSGKLLIINQIKLRLVF